MKTAGPEPRSNSIHRDLLSVFSLQPEGGVLRPTTAAGSTVQGYPICPKTPPMFVRFCNGRTLPAYEASNLDLS